MVRLPPNWRERLEELRREQNPRRYRGEQPTIQLPLPESPPGWEPPEPEHEPEPQRVIVIDLFNAR